jgi:16S rRNA (uracil1498-N3)-methyltransferase
MNLILLSPADILAGSNIARLTGRRLKHVLEILRPKLNDVLAVGLESGLTGKGEVIRISKEAVELRVIFAEPPPVKLPVVLCCALMRPPVFRRVLQTATSMGVGEIHFFQSRRVEKSFWQSTALKENAVREEIILGLEQAKDTVLPAVHFYKRFKPFVEDVLPGLLKGRTGFVADPSGEILRGAVDCQRPAVLILGPEGGFIPYEIGKFRAAGCRLVSLGDRILRVETAVVALLAKLF